MTVNTKIKGGTVAVMLLALATSCAFSLAGGDSGQVAMRPFFNDEASVRGVEPVEGWSDHATLVHDLLLGTTEDLEALVLERTSWTEMPEPSGTYRGRTLTWQLYSGLGQVLDAGTDVLQLEIGLAEHESRSYVVALLADPEDYEAHGKMYRSVFTHAMYAFEPMP
jgi:hypothetical protein